MIRRMRTRAYEYVGAGVGVDVGVPNTRHSNSDGVAGEDGAVKGMNGDLEREREKVRER